MIVIPIQCRLVQSKCSNDGKHGQDEKQALQIATVVSQGLPHHGKTLLLMLVIMMLVVIVLIERRHCSATDTQPICVGFQNIVLSPSLSRL
jgi:hypothetical protein